MNYRRGLFRLWLVASAVWIAFVLVVLPLKWSGEYFRLGIEELGRSGCEHDKECVRSQKELARIYFDQSKRFGPENIYFDEFSLWGKLLLLGAFVPPILVYILLRIFAWIIAGFGKSPPQQRSVSRAIGTVVAVLQQGLETTGALLVRILKGLSRGILPLAGCIGVAYLLWPIIGHWIEQLGAFETTEQNYERTLRPLFDAGWKVLAWKFIAMMGILWGTYVGIRETVSCDWAGEISSLASWVTGAVQCVYCQQWCENEAAAARCCVSEPATPYWIRTQTILNMQEASKRAAIFAGVFGMLWIALAVLFGIWLFDQLWFWVTAALASAGGYWFYYMDYRLQKQCSECRFCASHPTNEDTLRALLKWHEGEKAENRALAAIKLGDWYCSRCYARRVSEAKDFKQEFLGEAEEFSLIDD